VKISLSDEQGMLLETAKEFCKTHSSMDVVRGKLDAQEFDGALWQEMADLGWLGVNVPAEYGGLEMGLASVTPIIESMGRYLMGSPYGQTIVAIEALVSSASVQQKQEVLPLIAEGAMATIAVTESDGDWDLYHPSASAVLENQRFILSGTKCFVTDADAASYFLISVNYLGEARLLLLKRSDLPEGALSRETVIDQTRRSFMLSLDDITVPESALLPDADFAAIERAMLLTLCAEISGGLSGCIHTIVDYLNTRKAFGRHIGGYQSLKHPTVDILLSLEAARSHLYHAATLLDDGNTSAADIALSMAKAQGSPAYAFAGDRAVQFHGGFGFTFECDAQLFLRRALWCQYQFGDEQYHRQRLAPALLDAPVLHDAKPA